MIRYRIGRWLVGSMLGVLLAFWALPVWAGGWAAVTAEEWPAQFVVGEPYTLSLVVRQHGVHPVSVEGNVEAVLRSPVDGQEQRVTARAAETAGHYLLDVTFVQPGRWEVEVQPGGFPPMLLTAHVVAQQPEERAVAAAWWWPVIPVALAAGYVTRRARRGIGWQVAVAALVAGSTFALLGWSQAQTVAAAPTQVEIGQTLFSAKGCVACHRHDQVETLWSTEMGPNLTAYAADPDWLAGWLADPAGVRPQTKMPDLELDSDEIEALSAFLLAE